MTEFIYHCSPALPLSLSPCFLLVKHSPPPHNKASFNVVTYFSPSGGAHFSLLFSCICVECLSDWHLWTLTLLHSTLLSCFNWPVDAHHVICWLVLISLHHVESRVNDFQSNHLLWSTLCKVSFWQQWLNQCSRIIHTQRLSEKEGLLHWVRMRIESLSYALTCMCNAIMPEVVCERKREKKKMYTSILL